MGMKILIIGFSDSIHVVRWINRLKNQDWDIHLFPSIDNGSTHPDLDDVTVYHSVYHKNTLSPTFNHRVRYRGIALSTPVLRHNSRLQNSLNILATGLRHIAQIQMPLYRAKQLARLIDQLQPDIIHAMEFQAAGYLLVNAAGMVKKPLPPILVTNFGSDIYLFRRLPDHTQRVDAVLRIADYYTCECQRDVELAVSLGFDRDKTSVIPIGGSFDLDYCARFRQPGPTSKRKLIFIKGYQGWAGRSLVALHALRLCKDVLQGYEIAVHLPSGQDVQIAAELVSQDIGIPIQTIPYSPHERMLELMGRARVHIGLSISDAASTSMLESLVMGAFPIQSCTACADEYFIDGESGFLVPPEDPYAVAEALRRALTDDALVDRAAEINAKVAAERLEFNVVRDQTVRLYQRIYEETRGQWRKWAYQDLGPLPELAQTPLVSVITPLDRETGHLKEVIESVHAQKYPSFEHIILYQEETQQVKQFQAKYNQQIRWIKLNSLDLATVLKSAREVSRGDFVLWTTADEPVLPRLIATAVAHLQQHPNQTLVYSDAYEIDHESAVRGLRQLPGYTYNELLRLNISLPLSGLLMRRDALEKAELIPSYGPFDGFSLVLSLPPDSVLGHVSELLTTRRVTRAGRRSPSSTFNQALEKLQFTKELLQRNEADGKLRQYARDTLSAAYYEVAQEATHSLPVRARYAIKAWFTRPCLWNSGNKRLPTVYSTALVISPRFIRPLLAILKLPLSGLHPRRKLAQP